MKQTLIFLLILLFSVQLAEANEIKFRKVSIAELEQTEHPLDPEAEAAFLYKSYIRGYEFYPSTGGFRLNTYVHIRLKIYKKEGFGWGDFTIPYYGDGRFPKFRAYTYNLVNDKLVETRLENKDIYVEDINRNYKRRKFAMPVVSEGSVIDIMFEMSEPASISFEPFYMQHSIPVDYVKYVAEIPEYFVFNKSVRGLPIKMDVKSSSRSGSIQLPGTQKTPGSQVTYVIKTDSYIAENVPALKEEPFVPSMNNYRNAVTYELHSIQYPGARVQTYSSTWNDIAKRMMENENFGQQLGARLGDLNPFVQEVSELPEKERIEKIYYYVRDNFVWNGNYGENAQTGLRRLLSEKSGNIGDLNLLLINLLKKANVEVYPVAMSSSGNGFLNMSYPSYIQLNYVIAGVKTDDGFLFLDATDKNQLAGNLPPRALNLDGIILYGNTAERIPITNPNKGVKRVYLLGEFDADFKLNGSTRIVHSDYLASRFKSFYEEKEKDGGYLKMRHEENSSLNILTHKVDGLDTITNTLLEEYTFDLENQVERIGGLLYINPMLLWAQKENDFKSEKRDFAVFFSYTRQESFVFTIKIPEGYEVESLPRSIRMQLSEKIGSFLYAVNEIDGNIQVQCQLDIAQTIISPQYYTELRNFMILMVDKHAEKVVLKKA